MRALRNTMPAVAAVLALLVALGGTSYGVATVGKDDIEDNAVYSSHIRNKQVRLGDLHQKSVGQAFGSSVYSGTVTGFGPVNPNFGAATGGPIMGLQFLDVSSDLEGGAFHILVPTPMKVRDFRGVTTPAPVERPVEIRVEVETGIIDTPVLTCRFETGDEKCVAPGKSRRLKRGEVIQLFIEAKLAPGTLSDRTFRYSMRLAPL